MVLPNVGNRLSLSQIKAEFNGNTSFSSYFGNSLSMSNFPSVPTIGQSMSMSQFYGKSRQDPPTNFQAIPAMTTTKFTWTPPLNPVASYVLSTIPTATYPIIAATATSCVATGFTPNTPYTATLTAYIGTYGCTSASVTFTTLAIPPKYSWFTAGSSYNVFDVSLKLSKLFDMSGNNRHLLQPVYSLQPTLVGSGQQIVRFFSSSMTDVTSSRVILPNSDYTKMLLITHSTFSQGSQNYFDTLVASGNYVGGHLFWRPNGPTVTNGTGTAYDVTLSTLSLVANKWYVIFASYTDSGRSCTVNVNGTSATGTMSAGLNFSDPQTIIGDWNSTAPANPAQVDILEVATWNVPLTNADIAKEILRIQQQYSGITLN
jgi:Concanavalin A-like lectin/glucanases superfamily